MKASIKLSAGTRVKVTSGVDAGRIGTVQFNKGQHWYIALDGETRPANIVGREFYYTAQYKKNIELL